MLIRECDVEYYDELYHSGIKGMKWGHRKSYLKTLDKSKKKQIKEEFKKDAKRYKKNINRIDNIGSSYDRRVKATNDMAKHREQLTKKGKDYIKSIEKYNNMKTFKVISLTSGATMAGLAATAYIINRL